MQTEVLRRGGNPSPMALSGFAELSTPVVAPSRR
jgi:hypothetical protein